MQGKKNHQEKLFIHFQLSDYVPLDNFYRQLKNILDFGFLYGSTSKYYGSEGQKSIDPVVFMKLMLVGYLENLNSDRRIIASSRMRMDILYFPLDIIRMRSFPGTPPLAVRGNFMVNKSSCHCLK